MQMSFSCKTPNEMRGNIVYSLHGLTKIRQQMTGKTLAGLMKQDESMDPAG